MSRNRRKTERESPRTRRALPAVELVPLLIALSVFLVCCIYAAPFMPDDAFISFRYAENLADGHGLTFNVDRPPVEAYSNLLWILICALLYSMGVDLPSATPVIGVMIGAASLYVLWSMCRRRTRVWTQQLPPLLLLASSGPFVMYAVSGMESALFALLLLLLLRFAEVAVEKPGPKASVTLGLTGVFASLARPEGVLALPVVLCFLAWRARRNDAGALRRFAIVGATFVVVTVVYHAWRMSYYGEWLPTPFLSKGGEGSSWSWGWAKNFSRYFVGWAYYSPPLGYYLIALGVLGVAGARLAREHEGPARIDRLALIIFIVYAGVYVNFVDWMPAMRYHAPLVGILLVPIVYLHLLLPENAWRAAATTRRGTLAIFGAALLAASGLTLSHLEAVAEKMRESSEKCVVPLAVWLRQNTPPGSFLAIGDVGAAPYYSRMETLDIHPQSLTDIHAVRLGFSADYVIGRRPDVIALSVRGVYVPNMDPLHFALYKRERFQADYRFVGAVRHQWYEDRSYWVFVHDSLQLPREALTSFPEGIGKQRRKAVEW